MCSIPASGTTFYITINGLQVIFISCIVKIVPSWKGIDRVLDAKESRSQASANQAQTFL
jgi:hypothetical protein